MASWTEITEALQERHEAMMRARVLQACEELAQGMARFNHLLDLMPDEEGTTAGRDAMVVSLQAIAGLIQEQGTMPSGAQLATIAGTTFDAFIDEGLRQVVADEAGRMELPALQDFPAIEVP